MKSIVCLIILLNMFRLNIYAQEVFNKVPIRNYNSIDSISISDSTIRYFSKSGTLIYNFMEKRYAIDTTLNSIKQKRSISFKRSDFPREMRRFVGGVYTGLDDSSTIGKQGKFLLFTLVGEGGIAGGQNLIDTKNRIVYSFYDTSFRCFSSNDSVIYVAGSKGITKINKSNHSMFSNILLPIFNEETSFYEEKENIWLATDKLFIQRINKKDNSLDYWHPSTIIKKDFLNPYYSNIVEVNDHIIIGCRATYSYLLVYSKKQNVWSYIDASMLSGLEKLFVKDDIIYIGAHHIIEWEGGDYDLSGGFGYYVPGADSINIVKEIATREVVTRLVEKSDTLEIETYEPTFQKNIIRIYHFDMNSKLILNSFESNISWGEFFNTRDIIPNYRKSKSNYELNKERLDNITIKPIVILRYPPPKYFWAINY